MMGIISRVMGRAEDPFENPSQDRDFCGAQDHRTITQNKKLWLYSQFAQLQGATSDISFKYKFKYKYVSYLSTFIGS